MEIKKIFLVLVDISGYTKFVKLHKISLIHAELIISELLETIMKESKYPLTAHEMEGDSITFYAEAKNEAEMVKDICKQVQMFFEAFRKKESELISGCSVCDCEACNCIGKLKLKAVLHYGEAVFAKVQKFQKIAGEDVILAHRLLKNSIEQDEYILLTENFKKISGGYGELICQERSENCEGIGKVNVHVYFPPDAKYDPEYKRAFWNKVKMFFKLDGYFIKRLVVPSSKKYKSLSNL